jgi:membrane-associated phospholipid phosphatase
MTAALNVHRASTWPLERRDALTLVGWLVGMVAVGWAVGALLTGPLEQSGLVRWDESVSRWFEAGRTPANDDLAMAATLLADTFVKIIATAVIAGIVAAIWRSWRDVLMIVLPLILEATAFITITFLVGRPRPDVARLEDSPVDSSWPSGHTAAATAYSAIVIVMWWHIENRVVRIAMVVLAIGVPVAVGWARTYAGMHHVTDVVGGALLGATSVLAVWLVLRDRDADAPAVR